MRVQTLQITFSSISEQLDSKENIYAVVNSLLKLTKMSKVAEVLHEFSPQGISLVYVLAESHMAIHTWPEESYAYITISSCKYLDIDQATFQSEIEKNIDIQDLEVRVINSENQYAN